jgi:hypothetical protein
VGVPGVIAVISAAPPAPGMGDALSDLGSVFTSDLNARVLEVWPAIIPFVVLRVAFGLFEWWVDARARRKQPEQLTLF